MSAYVQAAMGSKLQAARQETRDAVAALHSAHSTCQETAEELREAQAAQATGERRLQDLRRATAPGRLAHKDCYMPHTHKSVKLVQSTEPGRCFVSR